MTNTTTAAPEVAAPTARRWWLLAVLLLGQFMGLVDVFIVNVAVPAVGADLHASGATLQLVVAGYTAAYAMLLITGARLGAVLGRRRMYLTGTILFTLASLGCGLASTSAALVALRCAQGAGAALMIPQVMSVIQLRFTGPDRARALSAYGVVLSAGAVAGMVVGGLLVGADLFGLGWRPAFFVNVPLGLLLVLVVPRVMPADPPGGKPRLDVAGLIVATLAVLLIVLPLTLGHELGWPLWTFVAIAAGLGLAIVFVAVERRVGAPLLNLKVLHAKGFAAGLGTLALMQIGYGGLLFGYTLYLQHGLGYDPQRAGLTYLPMSAAFGLVGYHWRRLPARTQRFAAPVGLTLCALAYLDIAADVVPLAGLAVAGIGMGLSASPLITQSLARVPAAQAADASGVLTTTIQLGQAIGVAGLGTVYLGLHASTNALTVTFGALAGVSALGAVAGSRLTRALRD